MPYEFKFPDVGEGIEEGEIVKWLVKEGDSVKEGQNIVQIETDKAVVDIPSPKSGKILKINFKDGETVKVGQPLVVIGAAGEKVVEKKIKKEEPEKKVKKVEKRKSVGVVGELEETEEEIKPHAAVMKGVQATAKVLASPAIRKKAAELGVDLIKIKGTGEGGRILSKDISGIVGKKEAIPQQKIVVKKKYDQYGYVERVPLKGIRKTIAENMTKSIAAPQVTSMEDIDVSKLWKIREKEKKIAEKKGIKLTFLPFIVKAAIAALKENPMLNSSLEGDEIIIKKYFNIGIAIETDVGLMVPVIKIAENKSIVQLAKEIVSLAEKAKSRKIDISDLKGGTFTITNYGSIGGNYATPILNPGEASILGLGRIFDKVLSEEGKLKTFKVLPVSLTFDHRVLDGAQAARFLESMKRFLEDPNHLLLA